MRNEKIVKFLDDMEKLGINTSSYHWSTTMAIRGKAMTVLKRFLKQVGAYEGVFNMRRCCSHVGCVNPFHYKPIQIKDLVIEPAQADEIADLMEMISIRELEEIGFGQYLRRFNRNNPLPAKPLDFFIACNQVLKASHKDQLDWGVFQNGNYES